MDILSAVIATLMAIVVALFSLVQEIRRRKEKGKEPTLQDRISNLTKSLESSVAVITEIEEEILKRKDLATQLETDVKRYEQLKEINQAQVEAIAQTLNVEIKRESRKSFWLNFATNLFIAIVFFLMGYFVGGR